MKLVIFGAPGVGKGTQAQKLKDSLNVPHISTGDMLRKAREEQTELGRTAEKYMNRGNLVPDDVIISIMVERVKKEDCRKGYLLDGFPRTVAQADAMEKNGIIVDTVVNIDVPDEEIIMRLSGRRSCGKCGQVYHIKNDPPKVENVCNVCGGHLIQRADDNENTVKERLRVYKAQTEPLLMYFQKKGILKNVDGTRGIEAVFSSMLQVVR